MNTTIKYLLIILTTCLFSCGEKQNQHQQLITTPTEDNFIKVEAKLQPSKYSSATDTIFINGLEIVLDSIIVKPAEVIPNFKMLTSDNRPMLAYVTIKNRSKETKDLPFVDYLQEVSLRQGVHTRRMNMSGGQSDEIPFRMGMRMFTTAKGKLMATIKPNQTLKGDYHLTVDQLYKNSALAFWYSDVVLKEYEQLAHLTDNHTVQGKPITKIIPKDMKMTNEVGFDVTDQIQIED